MPGEKKERPLPKVISYPIPRQFKDQIESEMERLGCYTKVECMGRIIDFYFKNHHDEPVPVIEGPTKGGEEPKSLF